MLPNLYLNTVSAIKFEGPERKKQVDVELKQVLPGAPRRLNTFIKTALLGAASCVQGRVLEQADVFLCSQAVSHEVMVELVNSAMVDMEPPKPVSFIHSIGNSANFYISQQLKLAGESLFFVEQEDCLAHMFLLSALKIQQGVPYVLLGCITQAEGLIQTSWMLLSKQKSEATVAEIVFESINETDDRSESRAIESTIANVRPNQDLYSFCQEAKKSNFQNVIHSDEFSEQSGFEIYLNV